jgi:hypothetical protein
MYLGAFGSRFVVPNISELASANHGDEAGQVCDHIRSSV